MEETKGRKLKSKVWDEFTKYKGEDGMVRAACSICGKEFDGSSKKGTTHLNNHLERCRAKKRVARDEDKSIEPRDSVIDLIKNSFEAEGNTTQHWDPSEFNSRKDDILQIYQEEKVKIGKSLNKVSSRFCLELGGQDDHFLLKVHYIDDSWEKQSKFIGVMK